MVTLKLKFRPSSVSGKEGRLYYQVIYKRCVRQMGTNYRIAPSEWDAVRQEVRLDDSSPRYDYLLALQQCIEKDRRRFRRLVASILVVDRFVTADDFVQEWYKQLSCTLFRYTEQLVARLHREGQPRLAETYASALNSFRRFRQGFDLCFDEIDVPTLQAYEYYLRGLSLVPNTVAFYMRRLRAICNRAVEERGVNCQILSFQRVHTAMERTVKRAVPLDCIRQLKAWMPLDCDALLFARDMFLFSFYTRGMSFIDMAYLRKLDLQNGVLSYRRKKTGQLLTLRWEPCMQALVDRHRSAPDSPYLLPIIAESGDNTRVQYRSRQSHINYYLHKVGRMLQFPIPLSMYVARHSWASIARNEGIPVAIISEGMGHDSESTTQIYLTALETCIVDQANSKILQLL